MNHLLLDVSGHRATVTLNRPDVRNAFNDEVIAELTQVFQQLGARDDVRCIVLAASGSAFCAGADLNWMRRMADYTREQNVADAAALAAMLRTVFECPSPPSPACRETYTPAAPAWWRPVTSRWRWTRRSSA